MFLFTKSLHSLLTSENKLDQPIAVADRMFLAMQDFDFAHKSNLPKS